MLLVRTMEMCGQRTMAGISLQDGKQGGIGVQRVQTIPFPVAFFECLSIQITQLWNSEDDKYTCRILEYSSTNFSGYWGAEWNSGSNKQYMWLAIGC